MISRRKTREYLLQLLYARASYTSSFDRDFFDSAFFEDTDRSIYDLAFVTKVEDAILLHERELLDIIAVLAPKFDLATMPSLHILILMIALSEMFGYAWEEIPVSVSTNEAIELAKRFSDTDGKKFVNGALSTFLKDREKTILAKKEGMYKIFGGL